MMVNMELGDKNDRRRQMCFPVLYVTLIKASK